MVTAEPWAFITFTVAVAVSTQSRCFLSIPLCRLHEVCIENLTAWINFLWSCEQMTQILNCDNAGFKYAVTQLGWTQITSRHRSFGTDRFTPQGADRVQDKSSYETSFPRFTRLPAHRACHAAARSQSELSLPAGGALAACCSGWVLHIYLSSSASRVR